MKTFVGENIGIRVGGDNNVQRFAAVWGLVSYVIEEPSTINSRVEPALIFGGRCTCDDRLAVGSKNWVCENKNEGGG